MKNNISLEAKIFLLKIITQSIALRKAYIIKIFLQTEYLKIHKKIRRAIEPLKPHIKLYKDTING